MSKQRKPTLQEIRAQMPELDALIGQFENGAQLTNEEYGRFSALWSQEYVWENGKIYTPTQYRLVTEPGKFTLTGHDAAVTFRLTSYSAAVKKLAAMDERIQKLLDQLSD